MPRGHSCHSLWRRGDLLASSECRPELSLIHTQDRPMANAIQPPNVNSAEDGRAYLDVKVQSNGKFSKAPMAVHESPHGSEQIKAEITMTAPS